ncbi:hypothetical protein P872_25505 [Rhodonellum psychrophilum GCM71 = DSM 17998]|uniref:Uncharacterized protein n=1 Tax=Rhodonellum psychrophilum GCM71 = DSM 17998 TaxID=1123057 RepID=U5C6E1_9BACT|nr:hypothetical protein P872_25505 [Rhodonellum psychrophilum GCM71 = DSM 17998]
MHKTGQMDFNADFSSNSIGFVLILNENQLLFPENY